MPKKTRTVPMVGTEFEIEVSQSGHKIHRRDLTIRELSIRSGVKKSTIKYHISRGALRATKRDGTIYVKHADALEWMKGRSG